MILNKDGNELYLKKEQISVMTEEVISWGMEI
jgi:hypothetical protein